MSKLILMLLALYGTAQAQVGLATNILVLQLSGAVASVATAEGNAVLATKIQVDGEKAADAVGKAQVQGIGKDLTPPAHEALNQLIADFDGFPENDQYLPLVDLAISTEVDLLRSLSPNGVLWWAQPGTKTVYRKKRAIDITAPAKDDTAFAQSWNAILTKNPSWKLKPLQ